MAKSRSRKARMHRAYAQHKRDKRRKVLAQRNKGKRETPRGQRERNPLMRQPIAQFVKSQPVMDWLAARREQRRKVA